MALSGIGIREHSIRRSKKLDNVQRFLGHNSHICLVPFYKQRNRASHVMHSPIGNDLTKQVAVSKW